MITLAPARLVTRYSSEMLGIEDLPFFARKQAKESPEDPAPATGYSVSIILACSSLLLFSRKKIAVAEGKWSGADFLLYLEP